MALHAPGIGEGTKWSRYTPPWYYLLARRQVSHSLFPWQPTILRVKSKLLCPSLKALGNGNLTSFSRPFPQDSLRVPWALVNLNNK